MSEFYLNPLGSGLFPNFFDEEEDPRTTSREPSTSSSRISVSRSGDSSTNLRRVAASWSSCFSSTQQSETMAHIYVIFSWV
ncbi:hypothetical protein MtrunA17_Chr4g0002291 [Medicago truncatula]|uniref:Uncharacterized protein n=1 Tax=Medicago truncatula TaxID=3880 RepID=A0A396HYJ2_MEDTR|nr:hypothetical protein MtrunA17_Chr4g0002291 [Medicago truncatula]